MATTVIPGRVDERVKARDDVFIRAAGLSAGDVIRAVWEHIAQTGEVPDASGDIGQQQPSAISWSAWESSGHLSEPARIS